jgi:hypothetical protein
MTTSKNTKSTKSHTSVAAHEAKAPAAESVVTTATAAQAAGATAATSATSQPTAAPPTAGSGTLAARITNVIAVLETLPTLLGSATAPAQPLTIEQRRALPKVRTGGDAQMPAVLALVDRYGLSIPGGSTADARSDLALVTILQPLETQLTSAVNLVSDAISGARGSAWETTTTGYTMLARLVKRFPALQTELDPMASFMATKHKDAPTILRQAEAKTLSKSRATLKAKKDKEAAGEAASAAAPIAQAAPPAQGAPVAQGAATPPPTNGVGPTAPAATPTGNGASHS